MTDVVPSAAPLADRGDPRRGPVLRVGLTLTLLAAATIVALVVLLVDTARGQRLDEIVLQAMYTNPRTDRVLLRGLDLVSEGAVALAIVAVLVIGAMRRRLDLGAAAAFVIVVATVGTQVLKYAVIERPDLGGATENTLPSGHVTVITSILVGLVIALPARWRPLLVPAVAFLATCGGVGTIVLNWHRPSDVIAAYAVVLAATGLAVAGLAAAGRLRPRPAGGTGRLMGYAVGSALAVSVVGVLILLAGVAPTYSRRDMLIAACALVAVAMACAVAIAAASYAIDLLGDSDPDRGTGAGPNGKSDRSPHLPHTVV